MPDYLTQLTRRNVPVHLVLLSRIDPALSLHPVRIADRLSEIRAADLAFTPRRNRGVTGVPGTLPTPRRRPGAGAAHLRVGRRARMAAMFLTRTGGTVDNSGADYRVLTEFLSR